MILQGEVARRHILDDAGLISMHASRVQTDVKSRG
jgi:hypothetical protein